MPMEMEMPDSFETGGAYLQEPGTFHLAVTDIEEHPTSRNGTLIDGFRAEVEVLGGPQSRRQAELMFFSPKPTDKNNGEMAKKKQARFALATGIIPAAKPGEKVTVDLAKAKGRQLIATLAHRESQTDSTKKFIDLNFADIWHVDDPSAPKCELSQEALSLLPKSLRRPPESFVKPAAGGNGSSGGNSKTTAPPAANNNMDDL